VPLPEQLVAATYRELWQRLAETALRGRSTVDTPQGPAPPLSNGEAVRVVYGWRYATGRSARPWRGWYALILPALGWVVPGDRFKVDGEHKARAYPPDALARLWSETQVLAGELDKAGARVGPLYLPSSHERYLELARVSWEVMKRGGTSAAIDEADGQVIGPIPPPPKPAPLPTLPDKDKVPPPPLPIQPEGSGGGLWLLIALGLGLFALGRKRQ